MSSIFDLNSDTSDSEADVDYTPEATSELSSEDECEDELGDESPKKPATSIAKPTETAKQISPDDVWKSFLSDVEPLKPGSSKGKDENLKSASAKESKEEPSKSVSDDEEEKDERPKSATDKGANEEPPKSASDKEEKEETLKSGSAKEVVPILVLRKPGAAGVKRSGLDSLVGNLGKKKKSSVLEQSLDDWKVFKSEEGIEEDLKTYNKGRGGFIERQRFLQVADVRSYEKERDLRLSHRKK